MSNFDLRKFLSENKLTTYSKILNENYYEEPEMDEVEVTEEDDIVDSEESVDESGINKYLALEGPDAIIKEIEADIEQVTFEAKMKKIKEVIEAIDNKVNSLEEDSELNGFVNPSKIKEMKRTVKKLRSMDEKYSKMYDKKYNKKK